MGGAGLGGDYGGLELRSGVGKELIGAESSTGKTCPQEFVGAVNGGHVPQQQTMRHAWILRGAQNQSGCC